MTLSKALSANLMNEKWSRVLGQTHSTPVEDILKCEYSETIASK